VFELDGKVAIVTGVGSVGSGWGNGRATATLLARAGAAIYGVDIVRESAEDTREIIAGEGGTCLVREVDMRDPAAVEAAVLDCVSSFGAVDVLVNNVGGSVPGGPSEMTVETWDEQIALNLRTAFLGCKFVLGPMVAQGSGAIVNVASVAGIREQSGRVNGAYSASKAAVIELSRSIAIRHARDGIRANSVLPGFMHTPLVERRLAHQLAGGDAAALIADRNARVPMGRMGDAWDVAYAILYLASDEACYVTGTELVVDGGLSVVTR
jgi:NAD(P)-dependent dehydrogenase (short-subunit alcohol dehydrogenase family)